MSNVRDGMGDVQWPPPNPKRGAPRSGGGGGATTAIVMGVVVLVVIAGAFAWIFSTAASDRVRNEERAATEATRPTTAPAAGMIQFKLDTLRDKTTGRAVSGAVESYRSPRGWQAMFPGEVLTEEELIMSEPGVMKAYMTASYAAEPEGFFAIADLDSSVDFDEIGEDILDIANRSFDGTVDRAAGRNVQVGTHDATVYPASIDALPGQVLVVKMDGSRALMVMGAGGPYGQVDAFFASVVLS